MGPRPYLEYWLFNELQITEKRFATSSKLSGTFPVSSELVVTAIVRVFRVLGRDYKASQSLIY